jgi:predicted phosphohydrolase
MSHRYAWATDVHLDFVCSNPQNPQNTQRLVAFAQQLTAGDPTGILLSGDLSVARLLVFHLSVLERVVQRPIYFVLGNHDYYGANVDDVRKQMKELSNLSPFLRYMPTMPYYALTPTTAVVGHDGWYDALIGDWQGSNFVMTDWKAIGDFKPVSGNKATIVELARKLAFDGVTHVHNGIKQATRYHKHIIVLTHFPPFRESHVHEGRVGDNNAQPWYTSKMMGDMLLDASRAFPQHTFQVLCGHTHGRWEGKVTGNLQVNVGGAEYDRPAVQGLVEVL